MLKFRVFKGNAKTFFVTLSSPSFPFSFILTVANINVKKNPKVFKWNPITTNCYNQEHRGLKISQKEIIQNLFIIFILVIVHDTDSETGVKHVTGFQPSGYYQLSRGAKIFHPHNMFYEKSLFGAETNRLFGQLTT